MAALTGAGSPPLVIFGDRSLARLCWHCLTRDARREVVAFSVDETHRSRESLEGLPVVAFERLEARFPAAEYELLIPIGPTNINGVRRRLCEAARHKGYRLSSYVSTRASVWPDTAMGANCLVFEQAVLQSFARLGDDVIVRSGANIGHDSVVGDHSFIATGVVTGGNVSIGEQCFLGLGAVVRNGIRVAPRCVIGAGAVLLSDTLPDGVYVGNPARRVAGRSAFEATSVAPGLASNE
jgi:sugar O-acyltransferase (sialic acid O-acetyltransferase NeuD family)